MSGFSDKLTKSRNTLLQKSIDKNNAFITSHPQDQYKEYNQKLQKINEQLQSQIIEIIPQPILISEPVNAKVIPESATENAVISDDGMSGRMPDYLGLYKELNSRIRSLNLTYKFVFGRDINDYTESIREELMKKYYYTDTYAFYDVAYHLFEKLEYEFKEKYNSEKYDELKINIAINTLFGYFEASFKTKIGGCEFRDFLSKPDIVSLLNNYHFTYKEDKIFENKMWEIFRSKYFEVSDLPLISENESTETETIHQDNTMNNEYLDEETVDQKLHESSAALAGSIPFFFPKSKAAIKELLPPPAAIVRKNNQTPSMPIKPLLNFEACHDIHDEWILKINISTFMGTDTYKTVSQEQMVNYAFDHLKTMSSVRPQDMKYIDLVHADVRSIQYRFAVERWLDDNFKNMTPTYRPVAALEFAVSKGIPGLFITFGLDAFIAKRFEHYISKRKTKLLNSNLSFLKNIDTDMFEFKYIHAGRTRIIAALRATVALGALAIYTSIFFKKRLTPEQQKSVQKSASKFSDIENLNSFLQKL